MFQIENGREKFYQWDTKQRLIVDDAAIEQVHFCNRTDDCSLKREVYTEKGKRIVNVPDILLQDDWRIHVYAFDSNYTKHEDIFEVIRRSKPQNYVYTEEEITQYEDLERRVDEIEKNGISDEKIAEIIDEYFTNNPIETGATAEQAAQIAANTEAIENIEADYASKEYVDKAIANIDIEGEEIDLSDYYTKAETNAAINAAKPDLSTYATQQWVLDKKYLTEHQDLSSYAKKSEIPSLNGYATEQYVNNAIPDVSAYQTAEQVQTMIDTSLGVIENGSY